MTDLITVADLNTSVNHEPRIGHDRLAKLLGYTRANAVRKLIDRNRAELERYGRICATMEQIRQGRGRPGEIVWLNEAQALLTCLRSDAPKAPDARQVVIEVYMAWRRGQIVPAAEPPPPPQEITAADLTPPSREVMFQIVHHGRHDRPGIGVITFDGHRFVTFDTLDYDIPDGGEAVVITPDAKIAVKRLSRRRDGSDDERFYRRRLGLLRPVRVASGGTSRSVVPIVGKVLGISFTSPARKGGGR